MKVGIVLLYGLFSPDIEDYREYLDFIAKQVDAQNLEKVILCGGFTNPNKPKDSEAATAKTYLKSIKPDFTSYILEDSSINTNQNLQFAAEKVAKNDQLIVYCDLIRTAKVVWMSCHFLLGMVKEEIYKALFAYAHKIKDGKYEPFRHENLIVLGFDFEGRTKREMIGQSYATLLDVFALYDEEFDRMDIEQRQVDFGLK